MKVSPVDFFSRARLTWILAAAMLVGAMCPAGALRPLGLQGVHWWNLVSYAFTHTSPMHLVVNLIGLMVCCTWCERRAGGRVMTAVFAGGVILGGAAFWGVTFGHGGEAWLQGASAGIIACGVAALLSYRRIPIPGATISASVPAYVLLAVLAAGWSGANPGGAAAHIGGWIAGCVAARLSERRNSGCIGAEEMSAEGRMRSSGYASLTEAERAILFNRHTHGRNER